MNYPFGGIKQRKYMVILKEVWGWCHIIFHDPCVTGDFFRFPYINPKIPKFSHTHPRITKKHQGVNVIAFGHLPGIEQPVCVVGGNCSVQVAWFRGSVSNGLGKLAFFAEGKNIVDEREMMFFVSSSKKGRDVSGLCFIAAA